MRTIDMWQTWCLEMVLIEKLGVKITSGTLTSLWAAHSNERWKGAGGWWGAEGAGGMVMNSERCLMLFSGNAWQPQSSYNCWLSLPGTIIARTSFKVLLIRSLITFGLHVKRNPASKDFSHTDRWRPTFVQPKPMNLMKIWWKFSSTQM